MSIQPSPTGRRLSKDEIRMHLTRARERTIQLMNQIPEECWNVQYHEFYSPVGWHFGHVGRTEEHWTWVRALGKKTLDEDLDFLYTDVPENPKSGRTRVPDPKGTLEYLQKTRDLCLQALEEADFDSDDQLLKDGYAWVFVCKHEYQHQETIAEMMHMFPYAMPESKSDVVGEILAREMDPYEWTSPEVGKLVQIPGGTFPMGTGDLYGYDNEYKQHEVEVETFHLMDKPVTFYEYHEYIANGGYTKKEHWSEHGRHWLEFEGPQTPHFYANYCPQIEEGKANAGPVVAGPHGARSPDPAEPIMGLSYYEAEAYANFKGLRLPTEAEWEYAATWGRGDKTLYAWGDQPPSTDLADCGLRYWAPRSVDQFSRGANPYGILGLNGGVWEWTSTTFNPYPGFEPFPYDGYSRAHFLISEYEEFFDQNPPCKVCRGGSWATAAANLYGTFRNYYPRFYRAGFIGVRLAL